VDLREFRLTARQATYREILPGEPSFEFGPKPGGTRDKGGNDTYCLQELERENEEKGDNNPLERRTDPDGRTLDLVI
jgi:hypothetical protein